MSLKNNQAELKDWADFLSHYPADDLCRYAQVRRGALWVWQVRTIRQIPAERELAFPGLQQIVAIHRHKTHKRSGATLEESDLAIPSLPAARRKKRISPAQADAAALAAIGRRHWAIENRLHHKRDTVLGEDDPLRDAAATPHSVRRKSISGGGRPVHREDACRTRKAAQVLAALRNLLLSFFHQLGVPVLRAVRRLATNPRPLFRWLNGCI